MNKSVLIKFLSLLATTIFSVSVASAQVPPIATQGNQLLFGGNPGSIAGPSLFWSNNDWGGEKFYTAGAVATVKTDWNAKLIRVAMGVEDGGGYLQSPATNLARLRTVVNAAIANDVYVIIDWHSHNAQLYTPQAVAFFRQMATEFGHHNNVIYEIYNEPLNVSWSQTLKPYAQSVIAAIRAIDPDNLIVVGTPNWSQDVDAAANDPITGYANIAYTLHFYSGTHKQGLRDKAQYALNRGIPLFVTEWGTVNANGDGGVDYHETNAWMDFLRNNNISHANWALNDKNEGASALRGGASPQGGWGASDYTASGAFVRDIVRDWPPIDGDTTPPCTRTAVPAVIQAEAYCNMSGVQTESTTDAGGGANVGWIDAGDWMSYSVNVPSSGRYRVSYRVAAQQDSGMLRLERAGGFPVYDSLELPVTGGWQQWTEVSHEVTLAAGEQDLAIAVISGGWNLNWIRIEPVQPDSGTTEIATLQAEDYSFMSGIQTEATSDTGGGLNVGWIDAGDWLSFVDTPVNIPASGTYEIAYRVASASSGGSLRLEEAGGSQIYGSTSFPATGGWQQWVTVKHQVQLSAGSHRFGIAAATGGWNINWFRISRIQ